jgi:hypothetical protein
MPKGLFRQAGLPIAFLLAILLSLKAVDDSVLMDGGPYFLMATALGMAFALPWRLAVIYFTLCAALSAAVTIVNDAKVSLTEMPLTFLDLRIALANPGGFLGAMKISWLPAVLTACAIAGLVAAGMYWCLSRWCRSDIRHNGAAVTLYLNGVFVTFREDQFIGVAAFVPATIRCLRGRTWPA